MADDVVGIPQKAVIPIMAYGVGRNGGQFEVHGVKTRVDVKVGRRVNNTEDKSYAPLQ